MFGKPAHFALLAMIFVAPMAADAQTVYVTDVLQLGIHRAQDTSDRPFENVVSGTPLEILERVSNYARVRIPDGQEGWVRSAFLVADKPAKTLVAELEAELAAVRAALRERETALVAAEETVARVSREMAASGNSAEAIQDTLGQLKAENAVYGAQLERYRHSLPLTWVATALVLALTGGFVSGWWALDYRIRQRHGGIRIY
jgi:SH3 domain protein